MVMKRRRGAPTQAAFAVPGERADLMRDAYYRQLNEHRSFRTALEEQRKDLALRFPADARRSKRRRGDEEEPQIDGPWRPEDAWLSKKARAALVSFAESWRLPSLGNLDVLKGLRLATADAPPKIVADHAPKIGAAPWAFIQADQPPSFIYDPVAWTPAEAQHKARAAAEAVYRQMVDQIESAHKDWRAQGRRPLPPRTRSRSDLEEGARRLFQRAVLGWNWKEIADDAAGRKRAYDEATVAESVRRWAQDLGVPLPDQPRRGSRTFSRSTKEPVRSA